MALTISPTLQVQGEGFISSLRCDASDWDAAELEIVFDQAEAAQVQAPMRSLFGRGYEGSTKWAAVGTGRDSHGGFIYYQMPFWSSVKEIGPNANPPLHPGLTPTLTLTT